MVDTSYRCITNRVLLIRPRCFGFNEETAKNNAFQVNPGPERDRKRTCEDALAEFDGLKAKLQLCGIEINEEMDREDKELPDSVFPNNWISFHSSDDGLGLKTAIVLYPMMAVTRREERQESIVKKWQEKLDATVIDLTSYEKKGMFLEGTGSMVLDRANHIAYACISSRTNTMVLQEFCDKLHYKPVVFHSSHVNSKGELVPVFHTNVVLSLCEKFALVCLDSIRDEKEKQLVKESLIQTGKYVVTITEHQMSSFLGNAIQLLGNDEKRYLFMSTRAYNVLDECQKTKICETSEIIHTPVDAIETNGGGGVRCMITEIFPQL